MEIGPFCVIGPEVKIAKGCRLLNSVTVVGQTTIGENNIFFPNSVLGTAPQDKKYKGAPTRLEIGSRNAFREAVTVHVGTEKGGGVTTIGDDNLFMVNSHIAHDVRIGSHCVIANNVMIAGHVVVRDFVAMMGLVGIHHFVTVGEYAYLAARRADPLRRAAVRQGGRRRRDPRAEQERDAAGRPAAGGHRRHRDRPTANCSCAAASGRSRRCWTSSTRSTG